MKSNSRNNAPMFIDLDTIGGSSASGTDNWEPFNPNKYWVVGTFLNYDVHEAPGGVAYTEIHLKIDRVLGTHAKPNTPAIGSVVDVGIGGGCLQTTSGEVHDFATQSYKSEMRPGHRYLVELHRADSGDFYDQTYVLADLSAGTAQPVTRGATGAAIRGEWRFSGLSEDAAIKLLEQTVAKNN